MAGLITITSRRDGFRRCGRAWSAAPTEVNADEFDADAWQRLRAEPMLTVVEGDADAAEGDADAESDGTDADIGGIIAQMDAADPQRAQADWWAKSGAPDLKELQRRGLKITAKGRNAAWHDYQAAVKI